MFKIKPRNKTRGQTLEKKYYHCTLCVEKDILVNGLVPKTYFNCI